MNLITKLWMDEAGSPTVESIFWIVIFVGVIIVAVTTFANKISGAIGMQGDNILAQSYNTYCASLGKGEWDGVEVANGAKPNCRAN